MKIGNFLLHSKITYTNIKHIYQNSIIFRSECNVIGEITVILEKSNKSLIVASLLKTPDESTILSIFKDVVQNNFPQCILSIWSHTLRIFFFEFFQYNNTKEEVLCPTCIEQCFYHSKLPVSKIGFVSSDKVLAF